MCVCVCVCVYAVVGATHHIENNLDISKLLCMRFLLNLGFCLSVSVSLSVCLSVSLSVRLSVCLRSGRDQLTSSMLYAYIHTYIHTYILNTRLLSNRMYLHTYMIHTRRIIDAWPPHRLATVAQRFDSFVLHPLSTKPSRADGNSPK